MSFVRITRRFNHLGCSLAVVALAIAALGPATASAQTTASKVAIANPVTIFQNLQQTKDLIATMVNDKKTIDTNGLTKQTAITDLKQRRDTLKADSPQWQDLNKQLLEKTIEYNNWLQFNNASIQQQQKLQIKMLYDKITAKIQAVALQRGIELVLAEQRPELPPDLDQISIDQLRQLLGGRNILYYQESVDISNQVIAALDADYKAGK